MIVMEPRSLIRIGYLFVIVGVLVTALLIYQTKDCPDQSCTMLLVYLSLVIMVTTVVIFIITYLFAMRLWLKRKHFKEAIPNDIYGKITLKDVQDTRKRAKRQKVIRKTRRT